MSMFDVSRVSVDVGDSQISFETGKLAKQAGGAVVVQAGDTMVLCTATVGSLRDVDFLPLTVDIEERMYAAGKIPGSFFRREGKSSEKATLILLAGMSMKTGMARILPALSRACESQQNVLGGAPMPRSMGSSCSPTAT